MGEGIAGLIAHELGTIVNKDEHHGAVFATESRSRRSISLGAVSDLGGMAMSVLGLHGYAWVRLGGGRPRASTILELTAVCWVQ